MRETLISWARNATITEANYRFKIHRYNILYNIMCDIEVS